MSFGIVKIIVLESLEKSRAYAILTRKKKKKLPNQMNEQRRMKKG